MTPDQAHDLAACRAEIELLDAKLVDLISSRVDAVLRAAAVKRAAAIPFHDPERETEVLNQAVSRARSAGLPETDVRDIFARIIALSAFVQSKTQGVPNERAG